MSHVVQAHYTGFVPRGKRLLRPLACWRCAGEMPSGVFECKCGFVLPTNWVNGQLALEESHNEYDTDTGK